MFGVIWCSSSSQLARFPVATASYTMSFLASCTTEAVMQDYFDTVVDHPTSVCGELMKQETLSIKVWVYWAWWG
jgi:hypothetical protein